MLYVIRQQKQLAEPVTQPGKIGYPGGSERLAVLLRLTMSLFSIFFDKIELMFDFKRKLKGWSASFRLSLG